MDAAADKSNEIKNEVEDENPLENKQENEIQQSSIEEKIVIPGNNIMKQIDEAVVQDETVNYGNDEDVSQEGVDDEMINDIDDQVHLEEDKVNKINENNDTGLSNNDEMNIQHSSQSNMEKKAEAENHETENEISKNKKSEDDDKESKSNSSDKISSIFNYTSIYSDIAVKNNSYESDLNTIQRNIESRKKELGTPIKEEDEEAIKEKEEENSVDINLINITKDNFLDILNKMNYEDVAKLKNKLSEIGIYNQFNDVLFEKQNKIIETLVEQKQDYERKVQFQKEEIFKLRSSVQNYDDRLKTIQKKTLNDICNRCGISFDKFGYPHRITTFGRALSKEEIEEKTRIKSDLFENGLFTRIDAPIEEKPKSLE